MRMRLMLVLCAALALGVGVAAGSSATTVKIGQISPQFIKRADRLCVKLNVRFDRALGKFPFQDFDAFHPDLKTLPLVGKHFAKALPIRRAIPAELRSLGEPATGKQAWDAIRTLALQENATGIKQVSVALASNAKRFVATVNQMHRLHIATGGKATSAGFPKNSPCGQTF